MTFQPKQIKELEAPLDAQSVKTREQAGQTLSYIEGWHAIAEANRIFGHDAWDRETALHQLGEPLLGQDKYGKDQWRVRFMATATIRVRAGEDVITRQGVGYGSGIAKDAGDAFEGAIKEAETDATKRALMTFGWPFGLALYDKSRGNVVDGSAVKTAQAYTDACLQIIRVTTDADELKKWWSDEGGNRRKHGITTEQLETMKDAVVTRLDELTNPHKEAAE